MDSTDIEENIPNENEPIETPPIEDNPIEDVPIDDNVIDNIGELSQMDKLKERIPYVETVFSDNDTYEKVLSRLLDDSWYIGLSLRYPYRNFVDLMLPRKYWNWQLRCCEQLYKLIGTAGIKQYSENGLSWTRDSAYLPYELTNEIEPIVGYILEDEESDIEYV